MDRLDSKLDAPEALGQLIDKLLLHRVLGRIGHVCLLPLSRTRRETGPLLGRRGRDHESRKRAGRRDAGAAESANMTECEKLSTEGARRRPRNYRRRRARVRGEGVGVGKGY